ncbi:hypothetical protein C7Y66_14555 [Chroococcidiopsis sp. CCALA 051]|uniref:hypothetical protein n=1 Tax=Chroococcidiopsis sp. CCALA 051 TaxID=869949 RepID=UPI000D0DACDB|nr:hypothetical protein [Chroococcidiopsis sp. CCALA 051]MBE9018604.1 hypothetical protein [Chroococcidiopsidales cyanobacterium LEGE 13417]PSM48439.1 hypothetical protein C7Y66_14555 [Chroococcidiopsis sp. CCALA 051]
MTDKLSDEEIIKKQERLYELESSAMAGRLGMTEEEQKTRIKEFLAGDHRQKRREAAAARREELRREIATTTDSEKKAKLELRLELLTGY